jgi:hypothetical protein
MCIEVPRVGRNNTEKQDLRCLYQLEVKQMENCANNGYFKKRRKDSDKQRGVFLLVCF